MALRPVCTVLLAFSVLLICDSAWAADPSRAEIEPPQITAHATHDTVSIGWDAIANDAVYTVLLYREREYWTFHGFAWGPSREFVVGPSVPYELTIDGLDPDSIYVIEVYAGDWWPRRSGLVFVRTEPVPEEWWEHNIARAIDTAVFDNRIPVYWDCLDEPLVDALAVMIREYGSPQRAVRSRTVACSANSVLSQPLQPGTVYEVALHPVDLTDYRKQRLTTIPSLIGENGAAELGVPEWNFSVEDWDRVRGWVFSVTVDAAGIASFYEVEWIRDGYRMTRVGPGPSFAYHSDSPGPFPFRVRRVTDNQASSEWSSSRLAGVRPQGPWDNGIRYQQRGAELHVTWGYGWHPSGIDGYRVYLLGVEAPPKYVDTGLARRAVLEIDPDQPSYTLLVGSYRYDQGMGQLARLDVDLDRQPELLLKIDDWQSTCMPAAGTPARGLWMVQHGVPPYRVSIGGLDPFVSVLPVGALELGCSAGAGQMAPDGRLIGQVRIEVEDASGRRMSDSWTYQVIEDDNDSAEVHPLRNVVTTFGPVIGGMNVDSDGVSVIIDHDRLAFLEPDGDFRFWVRWRVLGQEAWSYDRDSLQLLAAKYVAVLWSGLQPETSYQFQLASDFLGVRAEDLPEEAWSSLQEVRTWPGAIHPRVSRAGTTVTIRWMRRPNEGGYSVVVRGDGESWWKAHDPNGTSTEQVTFLGIPADAAIEVEVITPPLGGPAVERLPRLMPA